MAESVLQRHCQALIKAYSLSHAHQVDAVQVAVDVEGRPRQQPHAGRQGGVDGIQVRTQDRYEHFRRQRHHPLVFLTQVAQGLDVPEKRRACQSNKLLIVAVT